MTLLICADYWLSNMWPAGPPTAFDVPRDVNGVAITVGATVKFVATVTAIQTDPHFGDIVVTGKYPSGRTVVFSAGQGIGRSYNFPVPQPNKADKPKGFQPLELVVGS